MMLFMNSKFIYYLMIIGVTVLMFFRFRAADGGGVVLQITVKFVSYVRFPVPRALLSICPC